MSAAADEKPVDNRRVSKIKWNGSKVTIHYERAREAGEPDEFSVACSERPLPSFVMALQALAVDVLTICELPANQELNLTVKGVSLSNALGVLGAVITATKALETSNAPLILNTPHLPVEAYSGDANDTNPTLSHVTVERINALCVEALRYVDGEREQPRLVEAPADQAVVGGVH